MISFGTDSIPKEIFWSITCFLNVKDILRLKQSSKQLYFAIQALESNKEFQENIKHFAAKVLTNCLVNTSVNKVQIVAHYLSQHPEISREEPRFNDRLDQSTRFVESYLDQRIKPFVYACITNETTYSDVIQMTRFFSNKIFETGISTSGLGIEYTGEEGIREFFTAMVHESESGNAIQRFAPKILRVMEDHMIAERMQSRISTIFSPDPDDNAHDFLLNRR